MQIPERSNARIDVIPYFCIPASLPSQKIEREGLCHPVLFSFQTYRAKTPKVFCRNGNNIGTQFNFNTALWVTWRYSKSETSPHRWKIIKIFRPSLCYLGRATNTNVHENYRPFACHVDAIVWLQSSLIFPFSLAVWIWCKSPLGTACDICHIKCSERRERHELVLRSEFFSSIHILSVYLDIFLTYQSNVSLTMKRTMDGTHEVTSQTFWQVAKRSCCR